MLAQRMADLAASHFESYTENRVDIRVAMGLQTPRVLHVPIRLRSTPMEAVAKGFGEN